ncbi:MAG: ammonium transporter [Thermoplasmata archaeon]|nr:ammonium transporter [Thermoplasmata archaeon]MCI4341524.1 ammonium transporter [Thermoplasmata archaeon]
MDTTSLVNNLWLLLAALLVFTMTIAVGFLEVGELGEDLWPSLLKTTMISGSGLFFMALVGFNIAFAPTVLHGFIGNPVYTGAFLGGFDPSTSLSVWWSQGPSHGNTGLYLGTYFLFEVAFATVTLALVGVVMLRKVKPEAFALYTIPYFVLIWNLPAAWIWNPEGWLASMGMVDFAGGLVVHGAAGAAGLAFLVQIWREERARGLTESPQTSIKMVPTWLTLAILLLWVGWFGFNPGSVLQLNAEVPVVVLTTFLAAATAFLSTMGCQYLMTRRDPGPLWAVNGILMGLIVITPLAGFVSPASAVVLGLLCGPLFIAGERYVARLTWCSDPVGLLPGHLLGGLFGVGMIAFFTQTQFATLSGAPTSLPNGLLFGGGMPAVHQLGIEMFGVVVVMATVFALSFVAVWAIAKGLRGLTRPELYRTPSG